MYICTYTIAGITKGGTGIQMLCTHNYTTYVRTYVCMLFSVYQLLLVTVVIMASSASLRSHSHLTATDKMASIISSNASTI